MLNSLLYSVNKNDLFSSLGILWKGLLAMVIVVSLIIFATFILKLVFPAKEKQNKDTEERQ